MGDASAEAERELLRLRQAQPPLYASALVLDYFMHAVGKLPNPITDEDLMNEPITIECPHCRHRWPILYATLQAQRVVYRGEHAPSEEYTIPCPRCGESAVQRFNPKTERPNHE